MVKKKVTSWAWECDAWNQEKYSAAAEVLKKAYSAWIDAVVGFNLALKSDVKSYSVNVDFQGQLPKKK